MKVKNMLQHVSGLIMALVVNTATGEEFCILCSPTGDPLTRISTELVRSKLPHLWDFDTNEVPDVPDNFELPPDVHGLN